MRLFPEGLPMLRSRVVDARKNQNLCAQLTSRLLPPELQPLPSQAPP
jgi:hypothetical protein